MYFYIIIIIYSSCRHKAIKILVNIKKLYNDLGNKKISAETGKCRPNRYTD